MERTLATLILSYFRIVKFEYFLQNDKLKLLKPGSLQHLGENMLAFLLQIATSSHLSKSNSTVDDIQSSLDTAVYYDILVPS